MSENDAFNTTADEKTTAPNQKAPLDAAMRAAKFRMGESFGYIDDDVLHKLQTLLAGPSYFGNLDREGADNLVTQISDGFATGDLDFLIRNAQRQHYQPRFDAAYNAAKSVFDPLNNAGSSSWERMTFIKAMDAYEAGRAERFQEFLDSGYIPWAASQGNTPSMAEYVLETGSDWTAEAMTKAGPFTGANMAEKRSEARYLLDTLKLREDAAAQVKRDSAGYIKPVAEAMGKLDVASQEFADLARLKSAMETAQDDLVGSFMAPGGGFDQGVSSFDWAQVEGARRLNARLSPEQRGSDPGAVAGNAIAKAEAPGKETDHEKNKARFIAEKRSGLTPEQQDILGDLDLGGIFDQAEGNEKVAGNILKGYTDAADIQLEQGKTFKDILGPVDASGRPTGESLFGNVDPALRDALEKGLPVWGQGAFGSLVKGSPLYESAFGQDAEAGNAFVSSVFGANRDFAKDPGSALSEARKRLVQQAQGQGRGGDAAVLQAVYGIRTSVVDPVTKQASNVPPTSDAAIEAAIAKARLAGDVEGEQSLRSRLPGFKTRAEQRAAGGDLPTGTGKSVSRFYATRGLTGDALRQASERFRLEDEEETRQEQLRRNPPPRQRLK